jgi:Cu/Ag efflux pump CusA
MPGDCQAVVGVALMTLGENTRVVAQRLSTAVQQINKTLPWSQHRSLLQSRQSD